MNKLKEIAKLGGAFIAGMFFAGVVGVLLMPAMMIHEYPSNQDVDQTVATLTKSIEKHGWSVAGVQDMNKAMSKHGVKFAQPVRLIKLCKAEYAAEVLADAPFVSCLMPCTIGVYRKADGKTYIAKMNTELMGKLFGGTIARVMGAKVSQDEQKILAPVLTKP